MEIFGVTTSFYIDSSWHRNTKRDVIFAGSPLRAFRLSQAGTVIADALERGEELANGHEQLTTRLLQAGAVHPHLSEALKPEDITIVIPAFVRDSTDMSSLQKLTVLFQNHPVIVIDDASPLRIDVDGAVIIRHSTNRGPAAARNTALEKVSTTYVAFVDLDASITSDQLCCLGSLFKDADIGVVAPRVASQESASQLSHYEVVRSPLDMGALPALIRPGSRVPYVPAAILLARTAIVRHVGGFNETMRYGEDVDLLWRLSDAGIMCRYEPQVTGVHTPRASLRKFFLQRFHYGLSAAVLAKNHRSYVAPFAANILMIGSLISVAACAPFFAGLFLLAQFASSSFMLFRIGNDLAHACTTAIMNIAHSARTFADAVTRAWFWLFIILAIFFPSLRWIIVGSVVLPALSQWSRHRIMNPLTFVVLRSIDNFSYCAGVWCGVLQQKSFAALFPRIIVWRRRAG